MIEVEVENRSGAAVDGDGAAELVRRVLEAEGIDDGEVAIAFVGPEESRALKREHLGVDEATGVLSFPLVGRGDARPPGLDVEDRPDGGHLRVGEWAPAGGVELRPDGRGEDPRPPRARERRSAREGWS